MTHAQLQESLRVLGLGERSTLKEIKARHRELERVTIPIPEMPVIRR